MGVLSFLRLLWLSATLIAGTEAEPKAPETEPKAKPPVGETEWYTDAEAGVSFLLPFPEARPKTTAQVRELLLAQPGLEAPAGATATSGVYAKSGMPFLLVWSLKTSQQPQAEDLQRLSAQVVPGAALNAWLLADDGQRGIASATLSKEALNARVLVQLVKGGVIFIAYYFSDPADGPAFDRVVNNLTLTAAKRLSPPQPTPEGLWLRYGLTVLVFLAVSLALTTWRRRSPKPAPPQPGMS